MRPIHTAGSCLLVLALCLSAAAQEALSRADQATAAYAQKDYLRSAELYLAASEQAGGDAGLLYNAACSFALAGKRDDAFRVLERTLAAGFDGVDHLKVDTDLASLHDDPRWAPLVERFAASAKAHATFWNSPAMATPYRDNLSEDEKVAGLSKLWSEAKFNFVHFGNVPELDWDALYVEYLPKVRATKSTLEYYRQLMAMCARLRDGHSGVWLPRELYDEAYARPLVRTRLVEGKVVVAKVADPALAAQGVVPGLEVVAVDGVLAREHAERNVAPFQSASTPQDLDVRVYDYALLAGATSRPVELTLRSASGETFTRSLARVGFEDRMKRTGEPPMVFEMLAGNVAYVALNSFGDNRAAEMFEAAFADIAKADALILDVRENGGGNSSVGYRVLACLTDKPFKGSQWRTRLYRPALRAWGQREGSYGGGPDVVAPNGARLFTKPVVVLTSANTYSAAEDFVAAFKQMRRGAVVGEPTGGSTGQPLSFPLPGGGGARVCTKHDMLADGTEWVGIGLEPDRLVRPRVVDVRAGRDAVREAALEVLQTAPRN